MIFGALGAMPLAVVEFGGAYNVPVVAPNRAVVQNQQAIVRASRW